MALQKDESGFLLGVNRLKELSKGVDKVQMDISHILAILSDAVHLESIQRDKNYQQLSKINGAVTSIAKVKPAVNVTINTGQSKVTRKTGSNITVDSSPGQGSTRATARENKTKIATGGQARDSQGRFSSKTSPIGREKESNRDTSGRFTGSANGINEKSFIDSLKRGINQSVVGLNTDVSNLDPTVDAVRELSTLFAPGKKAFTLMGRGAMWLFKRRKATKAEDIPRVQQDHNDEVERHNTEQRKLFRKLIDAVNRGNSKGLAGLLGPALASRLLGGGGGRNGKNGRNVPVPTKEDKKKPGTPIPAGGVGREKPKGPQAPGKTPGKIPGLLGRLGSRVPLLGALVGGGLLASQWSDMDNSERGGGIGSMVGAGIGGVAGAIGGPVGSLAGATAGAYLGDKIGQKVGQWTGTLEKQNIGGTILKSWQKTQDVILNFFKLSMMGVGRFGMAGIGMAGGIMRASYGNGGNYSSGAGLSGGTPSDYNPHNEIPITKVLEAGKGYNIVELADGSVIKQEGNWNWRNRNAGNIEDGAFAKSRGRVDQSTAKGGQKRFATFPTYAAGRKAKKELIFEGQNYRDLDLMGAISRYAPKHENNTAAYQKRVLNAVGVNKRMSDYTAAEREVIMKAIEAQEGTMKQGKVTVLQGPTKNYTPGHNAGSATSNTVKPVYAKSTAQPVNQAKPLYVSNSNAVKPAAIPAAPNAMKRESSKRQQPALMASSNDTISQNPADRDIAHALTGGLGMRLQMA